MPPFFVFLLLCSVVEHCDPTTVQSLLSTSSFCFDLKHHSPHQLQHQLQHHQQQHQQHQEHLHQRQRQLLLSGDINVHPGPVEKKTRNVAYPCVVCARGVTRASKAISCDLCLRWTHVRCSVSVSLSKYDQCVKDGGEIAFVCDHCCLTSLPFANDDGVDGFSADAVSSSSSSPPSSTAHVSSSASSSSSRSYSIPRVLSSKGLRYSVAFL